MSASSGLEQEVTEWLHEQATTDGSDQVLAAALGRAHGVRQERSGSHSLPTAHFFRPMVAAAALAVAVMVVAVSSIPPLPQPANAVVTGVWPTGPGVVFTALLPPDAPGGLFWRGATFDEWSTEDRAWRTGDSTLTSISANASISDVVAEPRRGDASNEITVSITPHEGSAVAVAPGIPIAVDQAAQVETAGSGGPLAQVVLSDPSAPYRVTAMPIATDFQTAGARRLVGAGSDYPAEILERYAKPPDPREFGRESDAFIAAIHAARGDDAYEFAAGLVDAFKSGEFTYVSDTRDVDCRNDGFTECFLRVKRGYCVYFATAMVMVLRHEGIPARFVQGFLSGERVGSQVTVRTANAHAWVEVFFPGSGWVTFDPTPTFGPAAVPLLSPGSASPRSPS